VEEPMEGAGPEEEEEPIEEKDTEEDPSEGDKETLQDKDPKEGPAKDRVGLTVEENLVRRPKDLENEGVDSEEKRDESGIGVSS